MDRIGQKEKRFFGKELSFFAWHEISRADLLLLTLAAGFCFLTMYYSDITITSRFSLTLWDSLFDGRLLSFYDNALASGVAPEGAVYDIGIYAVFAIWGLPVWILRNVAGLDPMSVGSLLWFKLLLAVSVAACLRLFWQIAKELGYTKTVRAYASLVFLTSATLFFPVMVAAQYDIIPLFFILCGVFFWMKGEWKKFLIYFAVAATMKPFALLPLAVLVLLREKRIRRILLYLALAVLPMFLLKGIYSLSAGYRASCGSFLTTMLPMLLRVSIHIDNVDMSLFAVGVIGIYIFAYWRKDGESAVQNNRVAILVLAGIWAVFCLFVEIYPYWSVYLTPFLVLVVLMCGRDCHVTLLLDLVLNVCMTAVFVFQFEWVYGGERTFSYLVLKPLYESLVRAGGVLPVAEALRLLSVDILLPAFGAGMAAAVGGIFLCAGWRLARGEEEESFLEIWHIRMRILVLHGWIAACLAVFVFSFKR